MLVSNLYPRSHHLLHVGSSNVGHAERNEEGRGDEEKGGRGILVHFFFFVFWFFTIAASIITAIAITVTV